MKEEEPVDGKKSEDDGIEKENLAVLEKIRKNQRQDHLKVSAFNSWALKLEHRSWIIGYVHSLILHKSLATLFSSV